jgi:hypothetical protein
MCRRKNSTLRLLWNDRKSRRAPGEPAFALLPPNDLHERRRRDRVQQHLERDPDARGRPLAHAEQLQQRVAALLAFVAARFAAAAVGVPAAAAALALAVLGARFLAQQRLQGSWLGVLRRWLSTGVRMPGAATTMADATNDLDMKWTPNTLKSVLLATHKSRTAH